MFIVYTEDFESSLAFGKTINRGAGESDISCVGEGSHQVVPEISAGRAMRLVNQDCHTFARVKVRGSLVEFMNH